jgi:hypothetical protein
MALFAASLLLSGLVFAGKIATLQPGKAQIEAVEKTSVQDDAKPVKSRLMNQSRGKFTPRVVGLNDCERVITNATIDDYEVNWGYTTPGDSGAIYFEAPADMKVLAVRIRSTNWVGNLLLDFFDTWYEGDLTDGDVPVWFGDIGQTTPFTGHIAGPVPRTISAADEGVWTQIDVPAQPEFEGGDGFLVSFWFQITAGWGFSAENAKGLTADLFKWYTGGRMGEAEPYRGSVSTIIRSSCWWSTRVTRRLLSRV